jgi:archaeal flagellar protein FlaJ
MKFLKPIANKMFGWLSDKTFHHFNFLKKKLFLANIKIPLRAYINLSFFFVLLSVIFSAIVIQGIFLITDFGLPFMLKIVLSVFVPVAAGIIAFITAILYPSQKVNSRIKNFESNLPFALSHMSSVAESGVPPYVLFKIISEFEEYGEISTEAKKIVRNVDNFGLDPLSAIREVAKRVPSEEFKRVLLGFVSTTESGGNLQRYLKSVGEQSLFDWRIRREKFLQQISTYAEFYTGILIAAPLFFITMFALLGLINPTLGVVNLFFLTQLSIYVLIPLLNLIFLSFIKGIEVEV